MVSDIFYLLFIGTHELLEGKSSGIILSSNLLNRDSLPSLTFVLPLGIMIEYDYFIGTFHSSHPVNTINLPSLFSSIKAAVFLSKNPS